MKGQIILTFETAERFAEYLAFFQSQSMDEGVSFSFIEPSLSNH